MLQPDTTITFDLAVAGAAVTGTMMLTPRQGGEVTGAIENGTVADGTFSFSVRMGGPWDVIGQPYDLFHPSRVSRSRHVTFLLVSSGNWL